MLALHQPPPSHTLHLPTQPPPPPRYTITVNMKVLQALDSFNPTDPPSINQKDYPLQKQKDRLLFRQGTIAVPPPKRLSTSTSSSGGSNNSLASASTIRKGVSHWFSKKGKPVVPCPRFRAFLFNVHCSTCAARNANRHYSTQTLCPYQMGFNIADGRSGYILLDGAAPAETAEEVKERRRKIGKKMRLNEEWMVGKRVLSLDLCGYSRMAERANAVLRGCMVDSYVAMDLGSGGLEGELVDVGRMERALQEAGVTFSWETKGKSGVLG